VSFGESFLIHPDLFPARLSGEPFGGAILRLEIAGFPFVISGLSAAQAVAAGEHYRDLLLPLPAGEGDARLALFRAPEEDFHTFDRVGWQTTFDFEYGADTVRWAGHRSMARLELARERRAALWTPAGDNDPEFLGLLENTLRVVVAYRCLAAGGALFHSAGIRADERAWLFVGPSGAGKSTLCGLSQAAGHQVLSDELNALFLESGEPRLAQLPFAGDFGGVKLERASFPLAGIFLLRQGPEVRLDPVAPGRAIAALVAASPFINGDPLRLDRLLDNLDRIVRAADVRQLTFRLDPGFWSILLPRP
jgi:hypothetical protein